MRLGFPIKVYGRPGLPSQDGRRPSEGAHLSVSLAYLRDILGYLAANDLHMYRLHPGLLPAGPDATADQRFRLIDDCLPELEAVGALARSSDVRLSFHLHNACVLNGVNEDDAARAMAEVEAQCRLLDAMGQGPEAVVVAHVGGVYDNAPAAMERFVRRYGALSEAARARLVVENDDRRFGQAQVRWLHRACGAPLVLDTLHHLVHNPDGTRLRDALAESLATWPLGVIPKVHHSTPRPDARSLGGAARLKLPRWTEHADLANPFEFAALVEMARDLRPFDVMLEAKARDLAVLRLRQDLRRFAPQVAAAVR